MISYENVPDESIGVYRCKALSNFVVSLRVYTFLYLTLFLINCFTFCLEIRPFNCKNMFYIVSILFYRTSICQPKYALHTCIFILNTHLMIKRSFKGKTGISYNQQADINNTINDFRLLDFFYKTIGSIWEIFYTNYEKKIKLLKLPIVYIFSYRVI